MHTQAWPLYLCCNLSSAHTTNFYFIYLFIFTEFLIKIALYVAVKSVSLNVTSKYQHIQNSNTNMLIMFTHLYKVDLFNIYWQLICLDITADSYAHCVMLDPFKIKHKPF